MTALVLNDDSARMRIPIGMATTLGFFQQMKEESDYQVGGDAGVMQSGASWRVLFTTLLTS
jgi:hypothetical protein